jgi:hypothetical protein
MFGRHHFCTRLITVGIICASLFVNASVPRIAAQTNAQASARTDSASPVESTKPHTKSAAYEWLDIALEATAREVDAQGARPTVISRTLAVALTAMYDAWAAYDEKAVGTRLGGTLRRPLAERTDANKKKAIAYATYRALLDVYPDDAEWLTAQMRAYGYDPADKTTDTQHAARHRQHGCRRRHRLSSCRRRESTWRRTRLER